jgi:cytochrome b pre-mRNA-processing protein 3
MGRLHASIDRRRRARRRSQIWMLAVGMAALALTVLIWMWDRGAEERAIGRLSLVERQELYQRTLEDLRAVCGPGSARDLADHCQRQAHFILLFPECDADCERMARRQMPAPTR